MAKPSGLTPKQLATATGVTIRAMRLYERQGLITPERDRNGWRVYGPDAVARLYHILSLKRIGLSLAQVAAVIDSGATEIAASLDLQEDTLTAQSRWVQSTLDKVRKARAHLQRGETLSPDMMIELTQQAADPAPCWSEVFLPVVQKHLSAAQMQALAASGAWAQDQAVGTLWATLIADARALVGTDPSAPAAFEIVRRWRAAQARFTSGDGAMTQGLANAWRQAVADPELAVHAPVDAQTLDFVNAASLVLRSREARGRTAGSPRP